MAAANPVPEGFHSVTPHLVVNGASDAIEFYTGAARAASDAGDIGSRVLFEEIVLDEEGHKTWLELQLDLLQRLGESAYSARFVTAGDDEGE